MRQVYAFVDFLGTSLFALWAICPQKAKYLYDTVVQFFKRVPFSFVLCWHRRIPAVPVESFTGAITQASILSERRFLRKQHERPSTTVAT